MQRSVGVGIVATLPPGVTAGAALPPPQRQQGIRLGQLHHGGPVCRSLSAGSPTRVAPQGQESNQTVVSLSPTAQPRPQQPMVSKLLPRAFPPLTPAEDKVVSSATHVFLSESVPVGRRNSQQLPPKSPKSPRSPRPPKGASGVQQSAPSAPAPGTPYQPTGSSPIASPQHQNQMHLQQHQLLDTLLSPTGNYQYQANQLQHTYAVPYAGEQQQQKLGPRTRSHPNLVNDYINVIDASPEKPPLPNQGSPQPLQHPSLRQQQQQQQDALHTLQLQLEAAHVRIGRVEVLEREITRLADAHEALVRSAERGARLETAVRRRVERECALLRQENTQLRDQLTRLTEQPQLQSSVALLRRLMEQKEADLIQLEAENLSLKDQLKSLSLQHQQPFQSPSSK